MEEVAGYLPVCDASVVYMKDGPAVVPRKYLCGSTTGVSIMRQRKTNLACQYKLDDDMLDYEGKPIGGAWEDGRIIAYLHDDWALIRLSNYEPSHWFDAYTVCKLASSRLSLKKPKH